MAEAATCDDEVAAEFSRGWMHGLPQAIKDLAEANKTDHLVGSMAHGHAVPASIKNAFYDVITRQFNGSIDSKKAAVEMAAAAKN